MIASETLRNLLGDYYSPERVVAVLGQLQGAQESIGNETQFGRLADFQYEPGYHVMIIEPGRPPRSQPLTLGEFLVGRSERCPIKLEDGRVSRVHCLITVHTDHLSIRDLQSKNGTKVNGRDLLPERGETFNDCDEIRLAPVVLTLVRL